MPRYIFILMFIVTVFFSRGDAQDLPLRSVQQVVLPNSTTVLNTIAQDPVMRSRLLRQFAASSLWRVTEYGGTIVASREQWLAANLKGNSRRVKLQVVFGPYTRPISDSVRKQMLRTAFAVEKSVELPVDRVQLDAGAPPYVSMLNLRSEKDRAEALGSAIDGTGISIEVTELGESATRQFTALALGEVLDELVVFARKHEEVEKEGCVLEITPKDSIKLDKNPVPLEFSPGEQEGIYDLMAWVNPGEFGYVVIEAVDTKSGKPVRLSGDLLQYVGWSPDPDRKFRFRGHVLFSESAPKGSEHSVQVRLQFHPTTAKTLQEEETRVKYWIR